MLTPAQQAIVKAYILADPVMSAKPQNGDGDYEIAELFNAQSSPSFMVWSKNVPVQDIYDAIDWSKYTPVDAADPTVLQTNRLLIIQTKQMNLQNMLQGRETIDASKTKIRAGLRDAVIAIPAGASGAAVVAGGASGATVLATCQRNALLIEKILSTTTATTGSTTANLLDYVGQISYQDVHIARVS